MSFPPPISFWGNFHRFWSWGGECMEGMLQLRGWGAPWDSARGSQLLRRGGQRHLDRITSAHSSNLFQICPNPSLVALGFVSLPCTPTGVSGLRAGGAATPPLSASHHPLKSPQSSIQTFLGRGVVVYIFFPFLLFPPPPNFLRDQLREKGGGSGRAIITLINLLRGKLLRPGPLLKEKS